MDEHAFPLYHEKKLKNRRLMIKKVWNRAGPGRSEDEENQFGESLPSDFVSYSMEFWKKYWKVRCFRLVNPKYMECLLDKILSIKTAHTGMHGASLWGLQQQCSLQVSSLFRIWAWSWLLSTKGHPLSPISDHWDFEGSCISPVNLPIILPLLIDYVTVSEGAGEERQHLPQTMFWKPTKGIIEQNNV